MNNNVNDDDLKNLSIEEINKLYEDITEMPSTLLAMEKTSGCISKGSWLFN